MAVFQDALCVTFTTIKATAEMTVSLQQWNNIKNTIYWDNLLRETQQKSPET